MNTPSQQAEPTANARVDEIVREAMMAYPYTNYQYVAQNADVEKSRANHHALAIAQCVGRRALATQAAAVAQPSAKPVGVIGTLHTQPVWGTQKNLGGPVEQFDFPSKEIIGPIMFKELPLNTLLYAAHPAGAGEPTGPRDAHRGGNSYEASMLRNLLARIHGDGGHYVEQNGLGKALEDADALVANWRAGAGEQPSEAPR